MPKILNKITAHKKNFEVFNKIRSIFMILRVKKPVIEGSLLNLMMGIY
jgi:hypothetical protein